MSTAAAKKGNRCGHNPHKPKLTPAKPIRKGKGAPPRFLSIAAEQVKIWFSKPAKCPMLTRSERRIGGDPSPRRVRSERREAWQIILETLFSLVELSSLQLGTPTAALGFVDVDMKKIMSVSGMGKRRCERAMRDLATAGFLVIKQRRACSKEGKYYGLRAIRQLQPGFFEWFGMGGEWLAKERKKAWERIKAKAARANCKASDLMRRVKRALAAQKGKTSRSSARERQASYDWQVAVMQLMDQGFSESEARRRINETLGVPEDYSPGSA